MCHAGDLDQAKARLRGTLMESPITGRSDSNFSESAEVYHEFRVKLDKETRQFEFDLPSGSAGKDITLFFATTFSTNPYLESVSVSEVSSPPRWLSTGSWVETRLNYAKLRKAEQTVHVKLTAKIDSRLAGAPETSETGTAGYLLVYAFQKQ